MLQLLADGYPRPLTSPITKMHPLGLRCGALGVSGSIAALMLLRGGSSKRKITFRPQAPNTCHLPDLFTIDLSALGHCASWVDSSLLFSLRFPVRQMQRCW